MPNPTPAEPSTGSPSDSSPRSPLDTSRPPADATPASSGDTPRDAGGDEPEEPITPEYVRRLRNEAAEHRRARRAAEAQLGQLREAEMARQVEHHVAPRLVNPQDLLVFADPADLVDANGIPATDRIVAAVDRLLEERPYLAAQPRRPAGSGDGGSRGTPVPEAAPSIGAMIGRAARGES